MGQSSFWGMRKVYQQCWRNLTKVREDFLEEKGFEVSLRKGIG